jgi:hypothetical protein
MNPKPTKEVVMKCPLCAEEVKAEAKVCPHCQRDIATGKGPGDYSWTGGRLIVIGVFVVMVMYAARQCADVL